MERKHLEEIWGWIFSGNSIQYFAAFCNVMRCSWKNFCISNVI